MKYGLPEGTLQKICEVLEKYPQVEEALLYGSRAKGSYKPGSDIDLTLRGEGLSLDVLYKILNDLDDLLLPYTVDLSILDTIEEPALREHIQRVGARVYGMDGNVE